MKNYSCSVLVRAWAWRDMNGGSQKQVESFLDYTANTQVCTNWMFAQVSHLCILPPWGRQWHTHISKMWHMNMFFLAKGTSLEGTMMGICGGWKCGHRRQRGNPSCPYSVPSSPSVRQTIWAWLCITISHKKVKLFFLASLAFLQKVSTTYHKIVSHTKSVWHIWNIEKAEGFGGCAFSFKECIMCLELSEMTENYIEGQLHGHFYMFYLIILPVASHCMALYCIGVDLQLETSYLNPGSLLDPPSVAPHTETCSSHSNNCRYCCTIHNCDVVKTFVKKICMPFMNFCPCACPCQEEKGRHE